MRRAGTLGAGDRVLVTRLNYLGDVILSLPLVDAIRSTLPGVEVDYLTRRAGAELLRGDSRFGRVITVENGAGEFVRTLRALRGRGYAAAVDLYSNPRSAWLTGLSGAPVRIGGDRRGRRHFYTHRVRVPREVRRVTDVFLCYGAPLGVSGRASRPAIRLSDGELADADARLSASGAGTGPRVGIHPGGKWSVKRWPTARFADLIGRLHDQMGATAVVFTGPDEPEATERLRGVVSGGTVFLPPMGIRDVAATIARLDAMVACDGGVMHVAVATGTPTVGIFGSSEPAVWFPYEDAGPFRAAFVEVACRPCHRHECPLGHTRCLNDLDAGAVLRLVGAVRARNAEMNR